MSGAVALILALASTQAVPGAGPSTVAFKECEARVRRSPHDQQSYACFYIEARSHGMLPEASRRLERLQRQPGFDRQWAGLFLGLVAADQGQPRAERLFEQAADNFAADRNPEGVVLARLALARFLRLLSRIDEADHQAAAAAPVATGTGDTLLMARVAVEQAFIAYNKGDYGRSWQLLKSVEATTFSSAPTYVQSSWLSAMGATCWATRRWAESLDAYRRQAALLREAGDRYGEVTARGNILFLLSGEAMSRDELAAAAREALAAAEQIGNWESQARALVYLADASPGESGAGYSRRALAIARQHAPGAITVARRAAASRLVSLDRDEAFKLIEEGISDARRSGNLGEVARDLVVRSDMRWTTGPRSTAIADSLEAIDAAEAIRTLQPEALVRARRFSAWSAPYTGLVNRLFSGSLTTVGRPSESDFELAFSVMERRRARMLLDELGGASGTTAIRGSSGPISSPRFPSLGEVRSTIAPDEAIFAFQVASKAGDPYLGSSRVPLHSGSWLVVHTHGGTNLYEMPNASELVSVVSLFNGLIARRDGSEQAGARRLYAMLLERAVADIPLQVNHLILVPDETLYDVPFPALQDGRGQALGARYEISTVPSVTTWLAWRRPTTSGRRAAGLAFADPAVRIGSAATSDTRLRDAGQPGPLPQARREAASLRRSFDDATVRVGADASEHFIKTTDLHHQTLLHIAAHGLVDDSNPDRSAILLAPGSDAEDGILQRREIASLRLDGVVVLSACRSASGTLLSGEGVLGLAHAFFQAGAQAVIASLWPLRDDDAAEIFEGFYRELAKGLSVNAALKAARVKAIARGRPGAAWAGIVTFGNGDIVPIPGGASRHDLPRAALLVAIAASCLLAAFGLRGRRKSAAQRASLASTENQQ